MKLKKGLLAISLTLAMLSPVAANNVFNTELNEKEVIVEEYFLNRKGLDVNVVHSEYLYDVEGEQSYILFCFDNDSFAVFTRENMVLSEYMEGITDPYVDDSKYHVYAGPLNYLEIDNINTRTTYSLEIMGTNATVLSQKESENEFKSTTRAVVGIPTSRFVRYGDHSWANLKVNFTDPVANRLYDNGNGYCGTIASAVMLAYLDDYVDNNLIPDEIRMRGDTTPDALFNTLYWFIDYGNNGTLVNDLGTGLSDYLEEHAETNNWHSGYMLTSWSTAKPCIDAGRPVVVGLVDLLDNPYGNHWVTAYQYEDNSVVDYYYAHVNWENDSEDGTIYYAQINVLWTSSAVYVGPDSV